MDELRDSDESRLAHPENDIQEGRRDQDDRNGIRKGKGFSEKKSVAFVRRM